MILKYLYSYHNNFLNIYDENMKYLFLHNIFFFSSLILISSSNSTGKLLGLLYVGSFIMLLGINYVHSESDSGKDRFIIQT